MKLDLFSLHEALDRASCLQSIIAVMFPEDCGAMVVPEVRARVMNILHEAGTLYQELGELSAKE